MRAGLELWARRASVRLLLEDDASQPARAARLYGELLARGCRFVLAPYGGDSTRAVATAHPGGLVWNHGAAADDVQRLPGVVSGQPLPRRARPSRRRPPSWRLGRGRHRRRSFRAVRARGNRAGRRVARPQRRRQPVLQRLAERDRRRPSGRDPPLRDARAGGRAPARVGPALPGRPARRGLARRRRLSRSPRRRPRGPPRSRAVASRARQHAEAWSELDGDRGRRAPKRTRGARLRRRPGLCRRSDRCALP